MTLSHVRGTYFPVNFGIVAVVMFYFISGYLMNLSYQRFGNAWGFYADRVIRIYPAYLVVLLLTFCVFYVLGRLPSGFDATDVAHNVLLIPLNYTDIYRALIIPGFSLAAELHFYLLVPLLFVLPPRILGIGALLLTSMHIGSFFLDLRISDLGLAPSSYEASSWNHASAWLGYRWPFLILAVFLMGFLAARRDEHARPALLACWTLYLLFFFILGQTGVIAKRHVIEVALGAVIAFPVTVAIMQLKMSASVAQLDRLLGGLSYPLFLTHTVAIVAAEEVVVRYGLSRLFYLLLAWILSLALAYLVWRFVECNMTDVRYRLRGFGLPAGDSKAGAVSVVALPADTGASVEQRS